MNKSAIRKAVNAKVDEKIRKAIDDVAESEARSEVYRAIYPPSETAEVPGPAPSAPALPANRSRVFAPNDPKLTGG